jgi:hypothetical protein
MKTLALSLSLISLSLLTACGSTNGSLGGGSGTGQYSNASLSGQYVYQISGEDLNQGSAQYREAGVFIADGKGNITGGSDDFSEGSSGAGNTSISGSYNIANDGTGGMVLNFASGGSVSLAVTLISSSDVYLIEADTTLNASGLAEKQDSTAIASIPSGTFVFRIQTTSTSQGSAAMVGGMTVASGGVSGSEDLNRAGASSSATLTSGLLNSPDSFGRSSGTFSDSTGVTLSFNYYIVDSNNMRFLVSTPGVNGLGSAEMQTSTAGLSGSYAFGSKGDDSYSLGGVKTVGRFTASAGSITAGVYDSVQDAVPIAGASFSGTYTSSNGSSVVTLGSGVEQVFWTVSSSRAFFLTTSDPANPSNVEAGTADLQQSASFSNASLKGQYAFSMEGFDATNNFFVDRVGWLQWNGSGTLSLSEEVNDSGSGGQISGILSGSYSVASNGRATGTITSFSQSPNDFVVYLVSGSSGYLLQNDAGLEISGKMSQQQR